MAPHKGNTLSVDMKPSVQAQKGASNNCRRKQSKPIRLKLPEPKTPEADAESIADVQARQLSKVFRDANCRAFLLQSTTTVHLRRQR